MLSIWNYGTLANISKTKNMPLTFWKTKPRRAWLIYLRLIFARIYLGQWTIWKSLPMIFFANICIYIFSEYLFSRIKKSTNEYNSCYTVIGIRCCKTIKTITAWKVSVFGIILVRIFPHSDWIWRDATYLFVFSPNAGKCGSE